MFYKKRIDAIEDKIATNPAMTDKEKQNAYYEIAGAASIADLRLKQALVGVTDERLIQEAFTRSMYVLADKLPVQDLI